LYVPYPLRSRETQIRGLRWSGTATEARAQAGEQRRLDSGRYAFDAACEQNAEFLNCHMIVRDLVYDTVLAEPKLTTMPVKGGGGSGSALSFKGNPAAGKPQRFILSLKEEVRTPYQIARFLVEVHEDGHVVQRYSLAFPVVQGQKP
jgi:hypothetical protein